MSEVELLERKCNETLRVQGLIFEHLARPVFDKLGIEGEMTIRKGLRAFGNWRGKAMRKWHSKEGLPINMETLLRYWDSASARLSGVFVPGAIFTPYYVEHPASHCQLADLFKEDNWQYYGYIYCDEIHQEVCMGYHPKAIVEIHENLNKGDPACHFKWMMIPEIPEEKIDKSAYEVMNKRAQENPVGDAMEALMRTTHIAGAMYFFLADELIKKYGKEGRKLVDKSLRDLGARRGRELAEKLTKAGKALTIRNAFDDFDLAYKQLWKMRVETSNDRFVADVTYCPLGELWSELGNEELGSMYCMTMYESMFKAWNEEASIKIPKCVMKGASRCRFEFKI